MSEVNLRRRSSTSACRETEYKVEQSLTITEERVERNYEHTLFISPSPQPAWRARTGQQDLLLRAGASSTNFFRHGKAHD